MPQLVKNLPALWDTWVQSLGWEDPLEKEMAAHSSIVAWKIPWTDEPGELQSMGLQRVRHDWATNTYTHTHTHTHTRARARSHTPSQEPRDLWLKEHLCLRSRMVVICCPPILDLINFAFQIGHLGQRIPWAWTFGLCIKRVPCFLSPAFSEGNRSWLISLLLHRSCCFWSELL